MNGGFWIGDKCICFNGFGGDRCENIVNVVNCENGGTWDGFKC